MAMPSRLSYWLDHATLGIRPVPLGPQVVAAIRRQLPPGSDPSDLVFTVPGTDRAPLSRHQVKHVYQKAAIRLTDPTRELPSTVRGL